MHIPEYSDWKYWDGIIEQYISNPAYFSARYDIEYHMWNYFKICLKKKNPYFFHHAIIPLLETTFSEHTCVLTQGTEVYRARNDSKRDLWREWNGYCQITSMPESLQKLEELKVADEIIQKEREKYEALLADPHTQQIKEKIEAGFQGFDAKESSAPPWYKAVAGRCNPKGVSYLYAALEEHTAVAEIRPHIRDTISIAQLKPSRDLKLVCFDYEPSETVEGKNFLFNNIQRDFSIRSKDRDDEYLVTQYITALIENLGYDGLCFRSSLVCDGTNYVIFNSENCPVVSSSLFFLSEVKYEYSKCK